MTAVLPRFEIAGRRRPVDLVSPTSFLVDEADPDRTSWPTPHPAPCAAVCASLGATAGPGAAPVGVELSSGGVRLTGWYDAGRVGLEVTASGRTTSHASRRHGRTDDAVTELGLTLTGTHLTVLTRADGPWVARGRVDLLGRVDTRDESWLAALTSGYRAGPRKPSRRSLTPGPPVRRIRAGGFGQLGLRDLRQVTDADGTTYRPSSMPADRVLLTATSAGPGFFDTAHTSVWELDLVGLGLTHRADLFFRRPGSTGAYGDHATHLVRDGDRWLVATSTWGDFDPARPGATVGATLAETSADLLTGRHLLDTRPLTLPTTGLRSVGVWDPHLVRTEEGWLVGFVSATKFFRFHPALATGLALDTLELRAAASARTATEGTTLTRLDGEWRVLASDGRDGRRGERCRYPVLDLDLRETGTLDAPYPSNIPWPTLVPAGGSWLLVGFDGEEYGGPLTGYGTHGDVVLMRPV